jgi:PAS domain S-box-containing protein
MIDPSEIHEASILIVDDQEANVALLEQMLRGEGYTSIASTMDPTEVCSLHHKNHYDLILLDLQMPGMDGFEVMEALKKIETGTYLPVLVITAQPGHKLRALRSGAKDFVSKPFDLGEVLIRVYNMLEVRLLHRNEIVLKNARLENSQRIAGIGDWEYDFEHHCLLWSEEVYRILAISREDTAPNSEIFYRRVHPDDLAFVLRQKKAAAEGRRRVEFEHRVIRPDGKIRHIHQVTAMTFDAKGHPLRESGTLQDVTARKLAEAALRQSEERYRLMFEHNPSPVSVFDSTTLEFLAVNDAALALYGYSREESLRMTLMDVLPREPDGARRSSPIVKPLCVDGRSHHRKKDGTIFPADVLTHGIDFGGRSAQLVLVVDMTESERAAEALRTSEFRFRALSESAPLGIFECDASGRVTYYNPALTALSGRPVEDSLGHGWDENTHPDDRAAMSAGWARAVAEGCKWDQEPRLLRPDGSVRWVHTLTAPSRNADGDITGFVGTVEDITKRRAAELAVVESEERYRKMLMLSPDAHFVHVDGLITFVNRACCQLLGAENPSRLIGRPALQVTHPDFHKHVRERRGKNGDDQPVRHSEVKFVRLDGTTVDVEVASVAFDFRGRREVQVVARDISARNQAVTALRESEERFKLVARAVSDVVWDWDLAANTLWWNDGILTTFGFGAEDIEPGVESWTSRIHPDERNRVVESIHRAIDGGMESWTSEYRFQRKDETYAFVQDRGYILRDSDGKGIRMVGGKRDLTEQKEMEVHALRAQRMESIGTLAGGIAHDLNNVLAPIMMSIELLKLDSDNDPRRRKILDTVHVSCQRGADLVRQVLSFARGLDGQRVAIRLLPLIDDLKGIISETFPRNIRIVTKVSRDLWSMTGDPTQLHQLLLNLAVNARDAMPDGGKLTITAENVTIDDQYAGTSGDAKAGSHILLQVTDTGFGIPAEMRERIFEPFFTTKEQGKGTGLGLATVHSVIKNHGGFLNLESEVGRGTTFKIYLPADSANRPPDTLHPLIPELPRGKDELVLVIDDEFSIRDITQQTLETFGYRVITASDGAQAVVLYAKQPHQIGLVITDMMMPIMDGAATIHVLTRINPLVRVIATSGLDVADNVAKATRAGVNDFLRKPYTAQTLVRLVREVLDRQVCLVPA